MVITTPTIASKPAPMTEISRGMLALLIITGIILVIAGLADVGSDDLSADLRGAAFLVGGLNALIAAAVVGLR